MTQSQSGAGDRRSDTPIPLASTQASAIQYLASSGAPEGCTTEPKSELEKGDRRERKATSDNRQPTLVTAPQLSHPWEKPRLSRPDAETTGLEPKRLVIALTRPAHSKVWIQTTH